MQVGVAGWGLLLWSPDIPRSHGLVVWCQRSLKETAEGSRAGTPRAQSFPRQHGGDTSPPLSRRGRAGEVLPSLRLPAPARSACCEVHTLGKSRRKRAGTRNPGPCYGSTSVWVLVCGWWGAQGKPRPFRAASPIATGDPWEVQGPPRNTGPPVFASELAGCRLFAPQPSHCHSQKRGSDCSSLWSPAGSLSHQAKRSLNIPVPPRIQIYTVPGSPPCWTCCCAASSRCGTRR